LKGVIEMRWHHPCNLYTIVLGIVTQLVLYQLTVANVGPIIAIRLSVLGSFWTMGLLTLVWVRSYLRPLSYLGLERLVVVAIALVVLNISIETNNGLSGAPIAALVSVGVILISFFYLFPTPFVRSFQAFVLSRNAPQG
jgi:hypothetical protein